MSTPPRSRPEQITPAAAQHGGLRGRLVRAGLARPRQGTLIAGVAAGLARRFGVSPWLVRGVFVASIFLPGPQFLLYAALWIAMPRDA